MEPLRKELAEGVFLTYVPAAKFKTGVLGAQLITPLEESTVAAGALLPAVLRRGTTAHRDMRSIAAELDRLYGASIAYTVRKKGENQCLGFVGSFLDERYVPGGERLLEPMADLLGELLLDPLTRNGRFLSDYVESEKENLIDAIESILNDKRDYADARLLQASTGSALWRAWKGSRTRRSTAITTSFLPRRALSCSTAAARTSRAWRGRWTVRWQRSRASGSPSLRSPSVWARPKRCARSPKRWT